MHCDKGGGGVNIMPSYISSPNLTIKDLELVAQKRLQAAALGLEPLQHAAAKPLSHVSKRNLS